MEESSAQQQGAAFPAPPDYFRRYTQENLSLLEKARTNPEDPAIAIANDKNGFPIFALDPPPPVKKGVYWLFGRPWVSEPARPGERSTPYWDFNHALLTVTMTYSGPR